MQQWFEVAFGSPKVTIFSAVTKAGPIALARESALRVKSMARVLGESGRYVKDQAMAKRQRIWLVILVVLAVVSMVEGVIVGSWLFPGKLSANVRVPAMLGLLVVTLWVFKVGNEKVAILEKEQAAMKRGAKGESIVALILEKFPDSYYVINDLTTPFGNLDHIVVGPNGVFILDSKNWRGTVSADGRGELLLNGNPTDKPFVRSFVSRVMGIRDKVMLIAPGRAIFYGSVFVFPSAWIEAKWGTTGKVHCVRDDQLYEYIVERKSGDRLQPDEASRIAQALLALARMDKDFGPLPEKDPSKPFAQDKSYT